MNRNEPHERKTSREWKVTHFFFVIKNKEVTSGFPNF